MITFFLLLMAILCLAGIGVCLTTIFGFTFFVLFGDLIIFILIILGIVKLCDKKDK